MVPFAFQEVQGGGKKKKNEYNSNFFLAAMKSNDFPAAASGLF